MAFYPSKIKRHRKKSSDANLSLTSMMDIFIVILLFLLKSYSATEQIIATDESFHLPTSESKMDPRASLNIKINRDVIVLGNEEIASSRHVLENPDLLIDPLYKRLLREADRSKFIASQNLSVKFQGEITIQGDREIPFLLLKKVMYTCSRAEYGNISLAVINKET